MINGLYPQNFERGLKSMTCVQIERIQFDSFKNVKKTFKMIPRCYGNQLKSRERDKNAFTPDKIFQVREILQN